MTRLLTPAGVRARHGPVALALMALLLAGALAGCAAAPASDPLAAAQVNGQNISLAEYEAVLAAYKASTIYQSQGQVLSLDWQSPFDRASLASAERSTLTFLVTLALARQQLTHTVTSAQVQAQRKSLQSSRAQLLSSAASDPAAAAFAHALTPDVIMVLAEQQAITNALLQQAQVPTAHIRVLVVKTQSQAQNLEAQAQHGADFAQLAKKYSVDATLASSGGSLSSGTIYVGQLGSGTTLAQTLDAAIFAPGASHGTYVIAPVQGQYALLEITNRATKPLRALGDTTTEQSVLAAWLSDVVRPGAHIQQYIAIG